MATWNLYGLLTDTSGRPRSGATVSVSPPGLPWTLPNGSVVTQAVSTKTTSTGTFSINIVSGSQVNWHVTIDSSKTYVILDPGPGASINVKTLVPTYTPTGNQTYTGISGVTYDNGSNSLSFGLTNGSVLPAIPLPPFNLVKSVSGRVGDVRLLASDITDGDSRWALKSNQDSSVANLISGSTQTSQALGSWLKNNESSLLSDIISSNKDTAATANAAQTTANNAQAAANVAQSMATSATNQAASNAVAIAALSSSPSELQQAITQLGNSNNFEPLLRMQQQIQNGALRTLFIGDSNTEDVRATSRISSWPQKLMGMLRSKYFPGTGDQGIGYIPAAGFIYPPTGDGTPVANSGMDLRGVQLTSGQTRTWPTFSVKHLEVYWTSSVFYLGQADVYADGVKIGTIDGSNGQAHTPGSLWTYDFPDNKTRTISITCSTGTFCVEGMSFRTDVTGGSIWAAGRAGSRVKDFAEDAWWGPSISHVDPGLIICGFGGNDMAPDADWGKGITPEQWAGHWVDLVTLIIQYAPNATVIPLIGTERLADVANDPDRVTRYEAAMRDALLPQFKDRVFPVYESRLWAPTPGFAFDDPRQLGWLGDDIHRSPFGASRVASYILNEVSSVEGFGDMANYISNAALVANQAEAAAAQAQTAAQAAQTSANAMQSSSDGSVNALVQSATSATTQTLKASYLGANHFVNGFGGASSNLNMSGFTFATSHPPTGAYGYFTTNTPNTTLSNDEILPIGSGKYVFSVWVKETTSVTGGTFSINLTPYDINGNALSPTVSVVNNGTATSSWAQYTTTFIGSSLPSGTVGVKATFALNASASGVAQAVGGISISGVAAAQADATTALANAATAQSAATTAQSSASAAQNSANNAQTSANTAQTAASTAQSAANAAQSTANSAQSTANSHASRHVAGGADPLVIQPGNFGSGAIRVGVVQLASDFSLSGQTVPVTGMSYTLTPSANGVVKITEHADLYFGSSSAHVLSMYVNGNAAGYNESVSGISAGFRLPLRRAWTQPVTAGTQYTFQMYIAGPSSSKLYASNTTLTYEYFPGATA